MATLRRLAPGIPGPTNTGPIGPPLPPDAGAFGKLPAPGQATVPPPVNPGPMAPPIVASSDLRPAPVVQGFPQTFASSASGPSFPIVNNQTANLTNPGSYTAATPAPRPYGDFVAPNPGAFASDPSYQWRFREGQRALERGAAARGTLLTGRLQARLADEGQQMASQEYGNAFNRALQTYITNRDTNAQNYGQDVTSHGAGLNAFQANSGNTLNYNRQLMDLMQDPETGVWSVPSGGPGAVATSATAGGALQAAEDFAAQAASARAQNLAAAQQALRPLAIPTAWNTRTFRGYGA